MPARLAHDDAQTLLLAALEATPVNVTIADARRPDRPLVYVNAAFTRTTGYAAEEALGRNCRFLQGPGTDPAVVARMRDALAAGEPIEVELLNYRKDGAPFWNVLVVTPVRDASGRVSAFVGLQVDATERRRAAERAHHDAKMQALGVLAGGVAHEINNLLQPMLTFPELIRAALPASAREEHEWLTLVEEHARAARDAVGSILAFARRERAETEAICARAALERAVAAVRARLPAAVDLRIEGALASDADLGRVRASAAGLVQALTNLAINAVHAMSGAGTLTIAAERRADALVVAVADTGCGMTEEIRARIFEPFFTTKALGEGTGLGLAVVHADVARWGGRIEVASTPGRGSRFTIHLPIAIAGPGWRAA